jgi:hypothetical protein
MPDYLIIGMQRCGTSSLYLYLSSHPDWHGMTLGGGLQEPTAGDELHFFDYDRLFLGEGLSWYQERIKHPDGVIGEKSPTYLHSKKALTRIARMCPRARLIVMLRDPVKRAFSYYWKARNVGYETLDTFEKALAAEERRLAQCRCEDFEDSARHLFSYRDRGRYAEHLGRWAERFEPGQFIIIQSEQFFANPVLVVTYIWHQFGLEYPPMMDMPDTYYQAANYGAELCPETRRELRRYFQPHNERLMELLNGKLAGYCGSVFDLGLWYNGGQEK